MFLAALSLTPLALYFSQGQSLSYKTIQCRPSACKRPASSRFLVSLLIRLCGARSVSKAGKHPPAPPARGSPGGALPWPLRTKACAGLPSNTAGRLLCMQYTRFALTRAGVFSIVRFRCHTIVYSGVMQVTYGSQDAHVKGDILMQRFITLLSLMLCGVVAISGQ